MDVASAEEERAEELEDHVVQADVVADHVRQLLHHFALAPHLERRNAQYESRADTKRLVYTKHTLGDGRKNKLVRLFWSNKSCSFSLMYWLRRGETSSPKRD